MPLATFGGSEKKVPIKCIAPGSIENDVYNKRTDIVSTLYMYNIASLSLVTL